jgi:hypothetical protein
MGCGLLSALACGQDGASEAPANGTTTSASAFAPSRRARGRRVHATDASSPVPDAGADADAALGPDAGAGAALDPAAPLGAAITYAATGATMTNPERGLYLHGGDCDENAFDASFLESARKERNISLVICPFYLRGVESSPIARTTLDFFQRQMDAVRSAGMKAIVRFAYSDDTSGLDASASRIASHLDQLAPYLTKNEDVIAVVEAGFIGGWGEWAYSQHFGDTNSLSAQNWSDRRLVADKVLATVPVDRSVLLRLPKYKTTFYGASPLGATEAWSGSARARVGHQNDCFLASADDWGTYGNPAVEYPYLAADTRYVPMGGETCNADPPRSSCPTALDEMAMFHWSFINASYHPSVIDGWKAQGCFDEIEQRLGYRLALDTGAFSTRAKPGGAFALKLIVKNAGWAAPFNRRDVALVLRNAATGAEVRAPLAADPRAWVPGPTYAVDETVTLPSTMASGTYALFLSLADPMPSLRNRPEYAIQLANAGAWEAATGLNRLDQTVVVSP